MRPLTLADVVIQAARLTGEPFHEVLWCPPPFRGAATILVRTAAGWRQVSGPGAPRGRGQVAVSVTGARLRDRPRTYEAWYDWDGHEGEL